MALAKRIPGMVPGSTIRNVGLAFLYLITAPLWIVLFPFILGVLVWRDVSGWAGALDQLPGIEAGGGLVSGVVALVYGLVLFAALGAVLPGGDTAPAAGPAADAPPASTATPGADATPAPTAEATAAPPAESTPEPTPAPTAQPTATPESGTSHAIGESFQVGSGAQAIQYTVASASTTDHVGQGSFGEDADGTFVVVELQMTNVGDESLDLSTTPFRLVDSQGREFEVDTDALIYLDDAIVFEQLNPGLEKRGLIVFDVPAGSEYRLRIDPAGLFSGAESHTVTLGSVSN